MAVYASLDDPNRPNVPSYIFLALLPHPPYGHLNLQHTPNPQSLRQNLPPLPVCSIALEQATTKPKDEKSRQTSETRKTRTLSIKLSTLRSQRKARPHAITAIANRVFFFADTYTHRFHTQSPSSAAQTPAPTASQLPSFRRSQT